MPMMNMTWNNRATSALWAILLVPYSTWAFTTPFSASATTRRGVVVTPLQAYLPLDEYTPRDVGTFDEWATACGAQRADGIQLATDDGEDWSFMSTTNLPANTPLVSVPAGMVLNAAQIRQDYGNVLQPAVDYLARLGVADDDQLAEFFLFCRVLTMYEEGEQCAWYPWLNSLPRLFYSSLAMTDFCYECLPPLVFSYSRAERVKYGNFMSALEKIDLISDETRTDEQVTKWAYNIMSTRSFGEGMQKSISPLADMFNHGTETEVELAMDEQGNCNVFTTTDVPAGAPLRMSYGSPANPSLLFAKYGFLDETSPATFCKMTTLTKTPELENLGYDFSRMLFYKDTGDISEEVWDVTLYQVLAANKDDQQAFYQAHMNGDVDTKNAIHQHYFAETSTALKKHVDGFLAQLDELSAKSVGKDFNEHPRLPLILRHNEFVKETFLAVKANLDPMVAQAVGEPEYA